MTVLASTARLDEARCGRCGSLLFKHRTPTSTTALELEAKCNRGGCRAINRVMVTDRAVVTPVDGTGRVYRAGR